MTDIVSIYNVRRFGAIGDGRADDTAAIEQAIEACAKAGGGTVLLPAGRYLTAPLRLRSHLRLHLESGARLLFRNDFAAFGIVESRWAGHMCHCLQPCLFGDGLEDVAITGQGFIDGQGQAWWTEFYRMRAEKCIEPQTDPEGRLKELNASVNVGDAVWNEWPRQFLRPPLLQLKDCRRVLLEGVTLGNSPFWNTHILFCQDVTVHGVRFANPPGAPNGDGLDIDSSTRVRVSDCSFDVEDDCLCLKSGIGEGGRQVGRPTEDVVISNCTMYRGHGGVVLGSDTAGGIRNVTINNCVFHGTDRGVRIKSRRGRGGFIEGVRFSNILMTDVRCPLVISLYYVGNPALPTADLKPRPVDEGTPSVRDISVTGLRARGANSAAGFLLGLPESPIAGVRLSDVDIETVAGAEGWKAAMSCHCPLLSGAGLLVKNVADLRLRDVRVVARKGPAFEARAARNVQVVDCQLTTDDAGPAVVVEEQ